MTKYRIKVDTVDGKSSYYPEFKGIMDQWHTASYSSYKTKEEAINMISIWKENDVIRSKTVTTYIEDL